MKKDKELKEKLIKRVNRKGEYNANTENDFYLKYHNNAIKRIKRDWTFGFWLDKNNTHLATYHILRNEPYFMGKLYNIDNEYSKRQIFLFELLQSITEYVMENDLSAGLNSTEKYCCFYDAHLQNIKNNAIKKTLEEFAFQNNSNELENIKKNTTFMSNRTGIPYNNLLCPIIAGEYELYYFFSHYDIEKIISAPLFN